MKAECPHCGQHYEVDEEHVDQMITCLSCGQEFVVEVLPEEDPGSEPNGSQSVSPRKQSSPAPAVSKVDGSGGTAAVAEFPRTRSGLKALTCEMCGSTDLIKQNGVFVCQACGTKYSLEDARKMMIAGTVNVAGTVTVDNSAFVKKYLENARRALEKTDWDEVEKYYNLVEQNEPRNIEAIFYSSYGKAMLSLTDADRFKRKQKFDVLCRSASVIDDYYEVGKSESLKPVIQGMSRHLLKMFGSSFVYHPNYNKSLNDGGYPDYVSFPSFYHAGGDAPYTEAMFLMTGIQFIESIENIVAKDEQTYLYKILITHYDRCLTNKYMAVEMQDRIRAGRGKAAERLKQLDPNAEIKEAPTPRRGGCYIATAVYGSYDCPEVWTLRRFRDLYLAGSRGGRILIKLYYLISPTIVRYLGKGELFRHWGRGILDRFVRQLNRQGVSSKPYVDRM